MSPVLVARRRSRPATVVLVVIVATALGVPLAVAQTGSPGDPIAFHGAAVDEAGTGAPVGTVIVAAVDGEAVDRVTVSTAGVYAGDGPTDEKLRTTTAAGDTITFHVDGVGGPTAAQTHAIDGSGVFELDLVFPAGTFHSDDGPDSGDSSGGSASSGGGGGSNAGTAAPGEDVVAAATFDADGRASATVDGLVGGDTASIDLGDGIGVGGGGASITSVDVSVGDGGDDSRSITFEGTSLPGPPSDETDFSTGGAGDDALSYFELSVTTGADAAPVASATVTFTVDAAGLEERGLAPGDVALHRYNEDRGVWEELPTNLVGEADGELVYEATTPGFSLFAVGPTTRQTGQDGDAATPGPGTPTGDGAEADNEGETPAPEGDATVESNDDAEPTRDEPGLLSRVVPAALLVAAVVLVVLGLLVVRRRR